MYFDVVAQQLFSSRHGNLKNWEVIRSISVLKNATIHFKFKIQGCH